MGFHTYDKPPETLEDPSKYRSCSREELLWMLSLDGSEIVADLGSGTGFYTDDVAPFADTVYAVDMQETMHRYYREEKGVPDNVKLVPTAIAEMPLDPDTLDVAYSTMTFHEYAAQDAFETLMTVLNPGARLVTVDWTKHGEGEVGPPLNERYSLKEAREMLTDAGFTAGFSARRPETYVLVARTPE